MKLSAKKIATTIFNDGGRARDCGVRDKLKSYEESLAEKIKDNLVKIEIKHLNSLRRV